MHYMYIHNVHVYIQLIIINKLWPSIRIFTFKFLKMHNILIIVIIVILHLTTTEL